MATGQIFSQHSRSVGGAIAAALISTLAGAAAAEDPAHSVYRDGYVYTVDEKDSVQQAIAVRDVTVVQAALFWFALSFMVINLTVDLLYTVVDPRIRFS